MLLIPAKRTPRPAEGRPWRGASVASGACAKRFYKKSSYFDFTKYRPKQKKKNLYPSKKRPPLHNQQQWRVKKKFLTLLQMVLDYIKKKFFACHDFRKLAHKWANLWHFPTNLSY